MDRKNPAAPQPSNRAKVRPFSRRFSRGQMAVVLALGSVTLVGVMALGTDVGVLYYNWVQLQKAADAAALAGANYLPNDANTAASTAKAYLINNGTTNADVVSATPINSDTQLQVTAARSVPYYFARVLGLSSGTVSVSAIAEVPGGIGTVNAGPSSSIACSSSACTGSGGQTLTTASGSPASGAPFAGGCGGSTGAYNILPIAVDNLTASAWSLGASYTLNRVDSSGPNGPWPDAPGNWGLVDLCGQGEGGGAAIRSALANGYYGELSIGNTLTTFPGAKVGPVRQGLAGLTDRTSASPSSPSAFDPTDPRAVIVPLVSFANCSGECSVPITGFMAFYITSVNGGAVTGTFVAMVDPNSTPTINAPNYGAKGDVVLIK